MKPKKVFKGCLITVIAFFVFIFAVDVFTTNSDTSSENVPTHEVCGIVQKDGSILVDSLYLIYSGPNGMSVTMPKMTQPPYFMLNFKEPTQVFEEQTLSGADLNKSYGYALNGDMKEENGHFTYYSPDNHILRACLVESVTSKEHIYAEIRGGYPFNIVMTNFGKDIANYIESIDLHLNIDGEDKVYTFYPSDGVTYNKILSGLLHEDIQ